MISEIEQIYIFAILYGKWVPRNELFSSQIIRSVPRVFIYTHGVSSFPMFAFSVWIMRRFVINYILPQSRLEIYTISVKWRKQREYRMIVVKSSILTSYDSYLCYYLSNLSNLFKIKFGICLLYHKQPTELEYSIIFCIIISFIPQSACTVSNTFYWIGILHKYNKFLFLISFI